MPKDDRSPELADIDRKLSREVQALAGYRDKGDETAIKGAVARIDMLLAQRSSIVNGPPTCGHCNRVTSTYGTGVQLCPTCDFLDCLMDGCDRKARWHLNSRYCATCADI